MIETTDLRKDDVPALRERVHAIMARPIDEDLDKDRDEDLQTAEKPGGIYGAR